MKSFKEYITESNSNFFSVKAYHGTNQKINKFKGVVYFTNDKDVAESYGRGKINIHKKGKLYLYEVFLKFENPIYFSNMQQIGSLTIADIENLKNEGYDGGVFLGNAKSPIPEYVPFYPENIKAKEIK